MHLSLIPDFPFLDLYLFSLTQKVCFAAVLFGIIVKSPPIWPKKASFLAFLDNHSNNDACYGLNLCLSCPATTSSPLLVKSESVYALRDLKCSHFGKRISSNRPARHVNVDHPLCDTVFRRWREGGGGDQGCVTVLLQNAGPPPFQNKSLGTTPQELQVRLGAQLITPPSCCLSLLAATRRHTAPPMPATVTDSYRAPPMSPQQPVGSYNNNAINATNSDCTLFDVDMDTLEAELQQHYVSEDDPQQHTVQSSDTAATAYFLGNDPRYYHDRYLHLDGPPVTTCGNGHDHTEFDEERSLRRQVSSSHIETRGRAALHHACESFRDSVLDLYAASKIFGIHLVTFESLFVVMSSLLATTGYYLYSENRGGKSFGANISWMIVSFAIVAPMIMQIKQAFTRRELALDVLAEGKRSFV